MTKEHEGPVAAKVEREGLNPVVSSSLPPCDQGMYQSQASVEAIERMEDIQEKQAKWMDGLVNHAAIQECTNPTLPKPEVPVFGGDPVEYSNFDCLI